MESRGFRRDSGELKRWESAGTLVKGVNVRRDVMEPDVWRAAGLPKAVRSDSWWPLQRLVLPEAGCEAVMMRSGNLLGAIVCATWPAVVPGDDALATLKGEVAEIGQVSGEPLRFDVVEPGVVRVLMKHSRTCYMTYSVRKGDGAAAGGGATAGGLSVGFTWHGVMPDLPPMTIAVGGEVTMNEPIGSTGLSGVGIVRNSLGGDDLAVMTARMLGAYGRLKRRASDAGYFVQPTIARYRLLDGAGDTIAVSAPVAVGSITGFQCCGEVAFTSTDGLASLGGSSLSARVYRLRLLTAGRLPVPWNRIVKEAVVETLQPVEPVDALSQCEASATESGSSVTVKVRLPGIAASGGVNVARQRALVLAALAGSDSCFGVQGRVPFPFDADAGEHAVVLHEFEAADGGIACEPWRDAVSYGASGAVGELLALADRRKEGFMGFSPLNFAVGCTADAGASWRGVASVIIDRGDGNREVAVATGSCSGYTLDGLSPLLVYPDASAREMTVSVIVESQGVKRILSETFPLTAVPEAGIACYVSGEMRPVLPRGEVGSVAVPEPSVSSRCDSGQVSLVSPMRLSEPKAVFGCGGMVVAVAEAPRSRATWDFARHKMLLFGEDGIRVVAIDRDAKVRSDALLDNRPVVRPEAVCLRSGDNGLEVLAVAGGDLVCVGQSSVRTLMRGCRGGAVGWCGASGEIWLAGGAAPLRRLCPVGKGLEEIEVVLGQGDATPLLPSYGGRLLLSVGGGLLDASEEVEPPGGVPVELELRHALKRIPGVSGAVRLRSQAMPGLMRIWMLASRFAGKISVGGDRGTREAQCLVGFDIDGALNAPLTFRLAAPVREWVETSVAACVSIDAELRPSEFYAVTQK